MDNKEELTIIKEMATLFNQIVNDIPANLQKQFSNKIEII